MVFAHGSVGVPHGDELVDWAFHTGCALFADDAASGTVRLMVAHLLPHTWRMTRGRRRW